MRLFRLCLTGVLCWCVISISAAQTIGSVRYQYDEFNRNSVINISALQDSDQYQYNKNNQIVQKQIGAQQQGYHYDALGRLVLYHIDQFRYRRLFDINSNIRELLGPKGLASLVYSQRNQLLRFIDGGKDIVQLHYDAAGNMVSSSTGWQWHYDAQNQLVGFDNDTGASWTMTYAPNHQRLQRCGGKECVTYLYHHLTLFTLFQDNVFHSILEGSSPLAILSVRQRGIWLAHDARGDVVSMVSLSGQKTLTALGYGILALQPPQHNTVENPFYYADYVNDVQASYMGPGLNISADYDHFRELWVWQLRGIGTMAVFGKPDTDIGSLTVPVSMGLYHYANMHPTTQRDPTGHAPETFKRMLKYMYQLPQQLWKWFFPSAVTPLSSPHNSEPFAVITMTSLGLPPGNQGEQVSVGNQDNGFSASIEPGHLKDHKLVFKGRGDARNSDNKADFGDGIYKLLSKEDRKIAQKTGDTRQPVALTKDSTVMLEPIPNEDHVWQIKFAYKRDLKAFFTQGQSGMEFEDYFKVIAR